MPRRPKKGKSPSLLMRKLISNLSPVESAIVRERLLVVCEQTKIDMELFPDKYKNGFLAPSLLYECMKKVVDGISYEEEKSAKEEAMKKLMELNSVEVIG